MTNVEKIIQKIKAEVEGIPGIVGVVLGGSRARGTHRPDSDIDIGIYYDAAKGFNTKDVNEAAIKLHDEQEDQLITSLGEWGEWVNGGGWLVVDGFRVDLLFRDIHRVRKVIDECVAGSVSVHYQPGHPHGYVNVMYMGETSVCRVLGDPEGIIGELKQKTMPYPRTLKEAMIQYFSFEASFSHMLMEANIDRDDLSYVMGHAFRSISCLNKIIFAQNEEYCINEKKAVAMIEAFRLKPQNYKKRVDEIVSLLSTDQKKARMAASDLKELITDTLETEQ